MAPLAQNVGENPRHVPWNNKNTEFEGRRQNMMGYSLLTSMTEKNITIVPGIQVHHPVSKPTKIITDKETTVDPIRCLAVMKLARSVFAHKNQFYSLRYLVHVSHQAYSYEIYAVEICLGSQLCLCGRINGSIKTMVLQIAQYTKFCSVFGIAS